VKRSITPKTRLENTIGKAYVDGQPGQLIEGSVAQKWGKHIKGH